jgi:hypothetical protein
MSSSTVQQPNPMVAKLLDRARSINIRPDPEDTAGQGARAAAPATPAVVMKAVSSDADPQITETASEHRREPARKPRKTDSGRSVNRTFDIVTGPSTRALTVRIPEDVHARLVLIATSHRLARAGHASTLNELIAEGIEHVLSRYDAA